MAEAIQGVSVKDERASKNNLQKYFFWASYAALLSMSVPHQAFFFQAHSGNDWFDWIISYGISIVIESTIYVTTFATYKLIARGMTWLRFFGIVALIILNLMCSGISFIANWAYAAHFTHPEMLTGTNTIPFHEWFPILASGWPLLGIIYSVVSKTVIQGVNIAPIIDTRTPEQIEEDSKKEIALLKAKNALDIEKARLASKAVAARIGGTINAGIEGVKEGFVGVKEEITQAIKQDDEQEPEEEIPLQDIEIVPFHAKSAMPLQPPMQIIELKRNSQTLPYIEETVFPTEEEEKIEIEDEDKTEVMSFPITDERKAINSSVEEVDAKDVGFSMQRPRFHYRGLPYCTLTKVFDSIQDEHSRLITKQSLNYLLETGAIPVTSFLYVKFGKNRIRCILELNNVRIQAIEHLLSLEEEERKQIYA